VVGFGRIREKIRGFGFLMKVL